MPEFPFDIPKSLAAYVEQFDDDPLKVTTKLKNHLAKRGPDAVGYFLLSWFYHLKGLKEQAVAFALKAKTYAPGSPLMEKLHYYLSHPDTFEAWTPTVSSTSGSKKYYSEKRPEPVLDLDNLIGRLSEVESTRIAPEGPDTDLVSVDLEEAADDTDDIVSETLATIHENQGKTEAAIRTYKKLKKLNKEKSDFYKEKITRLKQLREEQNNENEDNPEGWD